MLDDRYTPEEERRLRRLLEAAAAPAVPDAPSPFFLARLRARLGSQRPHPVGLAALRLLAALLLVATGVSVWAAKESADVAREREAALARVADRATSPSDAILAALLQMPAEGPERTQVRR